MIKSKKIQTSVSETPSHWFKHVPTGIHLYLPYYYSIKVDMENMVYYDPRETEEVEEFYKLPFPDLNDMHVAGEVVTEHPYKEAVVDCGFIKSLSETRINTIIKKFKKKGFNVTKDAIVHAYVAWLGYMKSGYRDEKNGYHLFVPCGGWNPFQMSATTLHKSCNDWQTTYEW